MKTALTVTYCLIISLEFTLSNSQVYSQSHPPVYMTLVSHNEDNIQWLTYSYYIARRNLLVQIANLVQSRDAVWDFQSDWRFLLAVAQFDTGSVVSNTNGKNLIRWMTEDKGVICDPHSHENGYNYADVANLHQQLGIAPTKVVGGFLYDTVINGNNWENLENGIYGRIYTSYFWRPDILWGGGTPNHLNDPNPLGAWKPQSMANYFVHDSTKHLVLLGHGCENHITDTSNIFNNINIVRTIVDDITYGGLPDSGFYPAFSIFGVGDLTSTRVTKITEFIDSINVLSAGGRVIWKSLPDIYTIWNTTFGRSPYWIMCPDIPTAVRQSSTTVPQSLSLYQNYPNPFNPETKIKFDVPLSPFNERGEGGFVSLKIYDLLGREITTLVNEHLQPGTYEVEWNAANYPSGVYIYALKAGEFGATKKMILLK